MAANFMKEYHLIVDVMNACTHDISKEVKCAYLYPRIVDIFPPMTLDREEAKGKGSYDTMVNICNSAKLLSKEDFIRFVDATNADYPNRAREIRKKYQELSGNKLPHLPTALDAQVKQYARPQVQKMMASNDEEDENPAEVEYQTCNGENMKPDIPGSDIQEDMSIQVPYVAPRADTADMCFLHSSSTGYKAYRDEIRGSPFIEELTELIIKSKAADEIKNIIQQLQRAFSQKCLINSKMTLPDFSTQLVKSCYIIPE